MTTESNLIITIIATLTKVASQLLQLDVKLAHREDCPMYANIAEDLHEHTVRLRARWEALEMERMDEEEQTERSKHARHHS